MAYSEICNQVVREDDAGNSRTIVYAYDAGGNILSKKTYAYTAPDTAVSGAPTDTVSYSYADPVWKDKLTEYNGKAITYDEIGNPLTYGTGDEQWSFSWEHGRQLAGLVTPEHTISYKYNADGLRTQKVVDGVQWEYVWDGDKLIYMYDGTNEWRFIYDAGGSIVGFKQGSSTYYYKKNLQGDVISIFDNNFNEVVTYEYDSWGNLTAQGGSKAAAYVKLGRDNPIRYRGYFYDTDTGLYYLQSRYYNAQWGRFINADGTLDGGVNLYAYCNNDPIIYSDHNGNAAKNIIFVYNRKGNGFIDQAKWMAKHAYKNRNVEYRYFVYRTQFVRAWNRLHISVGKIKDIHIFIHGGPGELYFLGDSLKANKISGYLNKISISGKIYLHSCSGGTESPYGTVAGALSKVSGAYVRAAVDSSVNFRSITQPFMGKPVLKSKKGYWADFYYGKYKGKKQVTKRYIGKTWSL